MTRQRSSSIDSDQDWLLIRGFLFSYVLYILPSRDSTVTFTVQLIICIFRYSVEPWLEVLMSMTGIRMTEQTPLLMRSAATTMLAFSLQWLLWGNLHVAAGSVLVLLEIFLRDMALQLGLKIQTHQVLLDVLYFFYLDFTERVILGSLRNWLTFSFLYFFWVGWCWVNS